MENKKFIFLKDEKSKEKKSFPVNLPFEEHRGMTMVGMFTRPEADLQDAAVQGQP